jgi:ribosomal protein L40E
MQETYILNGRKYESNICDKCYELLGSIAAERRSNPPRAAVL